MLIVLVLACRGVETGAPMQAAYRLITEEVWGGGDIVLVSANFPTHDIPIRLILAGDTVPEHSRRADTVVFRAPAMSGTYRFDILPFMRPAADSKDEVRVYGYSDYAEGPTIVGYVLQVPDVSPVPRVLVRSPNALLLVDLRYMSAVEILSREVLESNWGNCWTYQFGPGRSYRSNFTSLCGGIWQVLPEMRYEGPGAAGLSTMQLAPERFVIWEGNFVRFRAPNSGGTPNVYGNEFVFDFRLSADRTRVTWTGMGVSVAEPDDPTLHGCPVFDDVGNVQYIVPAGGGRIYLCSAVFSPSGDTAFVSWQGQDSGPHLYALSAAAGEFLDSVPLPSRDSYGGRVAVDPHHPWLFFAAQKSALVGRTVVRSLELVAVDRRTMEVAGVMTTAAPQLLPAVELTLIAGGDAVYIVPVDFWDDGRSWERTMGRYRFDVLPLVD